MISRDPLFILPLIIVLKRCVLVDDIDQNSDNNTHVFQGIGSNIRVRWVTGRGGKRVSPGVNMSRIIRPAFLLVGPRVSRIEIFMITNQGIKLLMIYLR